MDIEFDYENGVDRDETRELSMRNTINMWLHELDEEITTQGGIIFVIFSMSTQHFEVNGVGFNLEKRIYQRISEFTTPPSA